MVKHVSHALLLKSPRSLQQTWKICPKSLFMKIKYNKHKINLLHYLNDIFFKLSNPKHGDKATESERNKENIIDEKGH